MRNKLKMLGMMRRLPGGCVFNKVSSPLGELTLIASDKGLCCLLWEHEWLSDEFVELINKFHRQPTQKYLKQAKKELDEYFQGKRKSFDVPIVMNGTEFQKKAWGRLMRIPYGETISYQDQALALGDKNKVRAVGSANGKNPISIIVPCHRVIGKNGSLNGFGGGLSAKKYLIELESH